MRNAVKVGPRVYLRPLEVGDARAIATSGHIEDDAGMLMDGRVPVSVLAFEAWIRQLGATEPPVAITFAICHHREDGCIGTATLRAIDWVNGTAQTGSGLLRPEDRNQGLGTEAKLLLLEYAFVDLGLHALSSFVFSGNARSARALEKQGYRPAGRLTGEVYRHGVFHDMLVFDITRSDWELAREGEDAPHRRSPGQRG